MVQALTKRKDWIDALRAMAMLFVVFGHQAQWCNIFFLYTTPIKIPLFFAISGYLFNDRGGQQGVFLKNCFLKLVVPFFCLVTIPALLFAIKDGIGVLFESWRKMLSGESFWFITCLIVSEVLHFYIRKLGKGIFLIIFISLICALTGLLMARNNVLDNGKVNTALISQFYLLIGYLIRKYEEYLDKLNIWWGIIILSIYIILCFVSQYYFESCQFDCHLNLYYNVGYCSLLIITGCMACFIIAKKIKHYPKWLIYVGQNTFILYLWAGASLVFFTALEKIGVVMPTMNLLFSMVQTLWATTTCMSAAWFVNRYIPFVVGKYNKK